MSNLGEPTSDDMVTVHIYDSDFFEDSYLEKLETVSVLNPNMNLNESDSSQKIPGLNNLKVYIDLNNNSINNSDRTFCANSVNNDDIIDKNDSEETETYHGNAEVNLPTVSSEIRKANEIVNIFLNTDFIENDIEESPEDETDTQHFTITDMSQQKESEETSVGDKTHKSRKRFKDKDSWQKEIRKRKRQAGEEYVSSRGKQVSRKRIKFTKDCLQHCRYKCQQMFSEGEIDRIHSHFWSLTDCDKYSFFAQTTNKVTNSSRKQDSRRYFTYEFFFLKGQDKVKVCKEFYFSVLQVDAKRVGTFYKKLEKGDGSQYRDMRGKFTKRRTANDDLNFLRSHIESFPRIASHYCRASSKKEYLESRLSLTKMYEMYFEKCADSGKDPLKKSMYRQVFNKEYNIGFHVPKKDLCNTCEEMKQTNVSDAVQERYRHHVMDKTETKVERDSDRERKDSFTAVVCFDLENVISLPRANVSNFFYKRKLNTYNLTAHCSLDKAAYNSLWTEHVAGRGANEIASGIVTILKAITNKKPEITSFILWSDSCVSQNKNSIMTTALKTFLSESESITEIVQKFCCPGHSSIQEVDNIHSHIEKTLKCAEVYSPVSLIRVMKSVRRRSPFEIIQMRKDKFFDFQKCSTSLKFKEIPYTRVKCLRYIKTHPFVVWYKMAFSDNNFTEVCINRMPTRQNGQNDIRNLPVPKVISKVPVISEEKKMDLRSMLKFMSEVDKKYYSTMGLVQQ